MIELLSAKIPLAGGGCYGYTADGKFAEEQLARIAGICGTAAGREPLPPDAFRCDIIEVQREEAIRLTASEPGIITVCEPYIVIKLPEDLSGAKVYVVHGEKLNARRFGFMWRRFYYLALISCVSRRNCSVVHGILASREDGTAAIISGPSGVGKSTASRRLPPPWKVLADDCLLVSRLADGFHAQPVPTWSIFYAATAPERAFDCARTVKLSHIFLLDRGDDHAEKLDFQQTLMGFTRSVGDMTRLLTGSVPQPVGKTIYSRAFRLASEMARELPCHHLFATLNGEFWKAMNAAMEEK